MSIFDFVFNLCVELLLATGNAVGLSYTEVNVVIFCILLPVFLLYLGLRIRQLKNRLRAAGMDTSLNPNAPPERFSAVFWFGGATACLVMFLFF